MENLYIVEYLWVFLMIFVDINFFAPDLVAFGGAMWGMIISGWELVGGTRVAKIISYRAKII